MGMPCSLGLLEMVLSDGRCNKSVAERSDVARHFTASDKSKPPKKYTCVFVAIGIRTKVSKEFRTLESGVRNEDSASWGRVCKSARTQVVGAFNLHNGTSEENLNLQHNA